MSFGSDSPGGSPEGIGGDESGIGGPSGSGENSGGFNGYSAEQMAAAMAQSDAQAAQNNLESALANAGYGSASIGAITQNMMDLSPQEMSSLAQSLNYKTEAAAKIASMPFQEQLAFFDEVVDPALDSRFGWQGKIASGIFGFAINTGLNAIVPGMGTLSKVTGLTKSLTNKINDMAMAQSLRESLGLSKDYAGVDDGGGGAEELLKQAASSGIPSREIINKINQQIALSGGSVMGFWEDITGESSADAALGAAGTSANYQQRALNYLQERDIVPRVFSEGAMKRLGGFYGLEGGEEDVMNRYQESPIYANLQAGRGQGEESIMRNAATTGGLRSGNTQEALYDYNVNAERSALGQYMQGLDTFTGYPSYATNIASGMAGIGNTLAQGQLGAAQANQAGSANLLGLGGALYQGMGGVSGIASGIGDMWDAGSTTWNAGGGVLDTIGSAIGSLF